MLDASRQTPIPLSSPLHLQFSDSQLEGSETCLIVTTCLGWGRGQVLLGSNGQITGIVLNMSQSTGRTPTYRPQVSSPRPTAPAREEAMESEECACAPSFS